MAREILKDAAGKLLGTINDANPDTRQWAYDSQGKVLGSFDAKTNTTKTAGGTLLTKGNGVAGLIFGRRG